MKIARWLWVVASFVPALAAACTASDDALPSAAAGGSGEPVPQCPRPLRDDEPADSNDLCEACPGMECSGDGVTCSSGYHTLGNVWHSECQCLEGRMVCCGSSKAGAASWWCAYGSEPSPVCPLEQPVNDAACGNKPMYCRYSSACCVESVAGCRDGVWQVECAESANQVGPDCAGGAAGVAGAPSAAGAPD